MRKYFSVNVKRYNPEKDFEVYSPASLANPHNNCVIFVTKEYLSQFLKISVSNCLIFCPEDYVIPCDSNLYIKAKDPRERYCLFFEENQIESREKSNDFDVIGGSFISKGSRIPDSCTIFPGCYVGSEVILGENVYLGSGVKLIGRVTIGDNVCIKENSVIGADGLTTNRHQDGSPLQMPQFGGVKIEDSVLIGANSVIARGAIDDTVIESGCQIDNCSFISHNVHLGKNTFVVGETLFMGSASTKDNVFVSGNCIIRNGVQIGTNSVIGMGSVVTKDIPEDVTVFGNPAKVR